MAYTVRDFCFQAFRLISAQNPTIPLHGDDEKLCIQVLNQLMRFYASNGLMLTIAKTVDTTVNLNIKTILFAPIDYPTSTTLREIVTLSNGSPTFTVVNGSLYFAGDAVSGNGIPAATEILTVFGNTITLTANATLSGQSNLTFIHDTSDPTVAYIKQGRLANLDNAWLVLSGVTYPLILKSRDEFLAAWKYEPLQGLPRFLITYPETQFVEAQLYPAPSQFYEFFARGKFQLPTLTSNDDMSSLPEYYIRFLLPAVAKDVSLYTGRAEAWTQRLEEMYREAKDVMESASEVNLSITGDEQSLLNGAWRVRAGI